MKQFLKENPTLAFGLGLPVLMVIIFSVAAGLPSLTATPPKYDLIFATNYYDHSNAEGFRISVTEGKARMVFVGEGYCNKPNLYRYHAARGAVTRIDYTEPAGMCGNNRDYDKQNKSKVTPVSVPDLENLKLDNANPAPDGYEFAQRGGYSSSGILPSLFFSRSYYNDEPVLRKGTYRLRLPLEDRYTSYYNTHFIGWVVSHD